MKFELWKLNKWIMVISLIIISAMLLAPSRYSSDAKAEGINYLNDQIYPDEELANMLQSMKDQNAPNTILEDVKKEQELYKNILKATQQDDYENKIKYEAELARSNLKQIKSGSLVGRTVTEQQLLVTELDYFEAHPNIKRIDYFYETNFPAANYLPRAFQQLSYPLLLSIGAIGIALAMTYEKRKKTDIFLATVPRKMTRLMACKIGLVFASVFSVFVFSLLVIVGVMTVKEGFGSWNYPIFFLTYSHEVQQTTVLNFTLLMILATGLFWLFLTCFSCLIQYFSQNFFINFILQEVWILPILLATLYVPGQPSISTIDSTISPSLAKGLPTSYFDFPRLLLDQNVWSLADLTWQKGIIFLLLGSGIFLAGSLYLAKRQENIPKNRANLEN